MVWCFALDRYDIYRALSEPLQVLATLQKLAFSSVRFSCDLTGKGIGSGSLLVNFTVQTWILHWHAHNNGGVVLRCTCAPGSSRVVNISRRDGASLIETSTSILDTYSQTHGNHIVSIVLSMFSGLSTLLFNGVFWHCESWSFADLENQ